MRILNTFIFLSCLTLILHAQSPPSPGCIGAPIECNFDEIDGLCAQMFTDVNPGGPNPLCPDGGGAHNMSWWAFVAGSTFIDMDVMLTDCDTVTLTNGNELTGVQFGIYTDCTYTDSPWCLSSCSDAPVTNVYIDPLIIGQTYYFFMDGCAGSVCDYCITVNSGGGLGSLDESNLTGVQCITDPTCMVGGEIHVCEGAVNYVLELGGADYDLEYTWFLDGGEYEVINSDNEVSFDFPTSGTYEVCVDVNNSCDWTELYCVDVVVAALPDEIFDPITWCESDGDIPGSEIMGPGLTWNGGNISFPLATNPVINTETNSLGCEVEQSVMVTVNPPNADIYLEAVICNGDSYEVFPGEDFNSIQFDFNEIVQDIAAPDCNQSYFLDLQVVNFTPTIVQGACTENGVELCVELNNMWTPNNGDEDFSWYWQTNGSGFSNEDIECIFVDINSTDTYSVVYTIELDAPDNLGGVPVECIEESDQVIIDITEFGLEFDGSSDLIGNITVCEGMETSVVYSVDDSDFPNPSELTYVWTVTNGSIEAGQGSNSITVDWTGTNGGTVTWTIESACGTNPGGMANVTITTNPTPAIAAPLTVCPDTELTIEITNALSTFLPGTLLWGLDGGTVTNGTETDINPFAVTWATGGPKQLTVELDYGCGTVYDTLNIQVQVDPAFPDYNCVNGVGVITFDWADIPGADSYDIMIVGGGTDVSATSDYTINANPGETVEIIVTVNGTAFCGPITSVTLPCTALNCPAIDVSIDLDFPDTICISGGAFTGNFSAIDANSNTGDYFYFGPGVDTLTGAFTTDTLIAGTYTVSTLFETPEGCSSGLIDTTITLVDQPTMDITADVLVVCINDPVVLSIVGNNDLSSATINYDLGIVDTDDGNGNVSLHWATAGIYTVTVETSVLGCSAPGYDEVTIEVQSLPAINLMCNGSTTTSISVSWDVDPAYSSYEVYVGGVLYSTVTIGSETITGIAPMGSANIQVVPIAMNSVCTAAEEMVPCVASGCDPVPFSIQAPSAQMLFCDMAPFNLIQLEAIYDPSAFTGPSTVTWSGAGVNPATGMLDPNVMGAGDFTISATLEGDACPYPASMMITIEDVPQTSINLSNQTICIDQTLDLQYTGTPIGTGFNFTWTGLPASANSNDINPGLLNWNTPGTYDVLLEVGSVNCPTTPIPLQIEVVDSTRTPIPDCGNQQMDQINLTWIVGNSDCNGEFTVYVNGVIATVTSDNFFDITGLNADQDVMIRIVNENPNCLCPSKEVEFMCATSACPTSMVNINVPDTTVCLNQLANIQLEAFYDNTVFSGSEDIIWSGLGVDPTTGEFNPLVAGIGSHIITVSISEGACPASTQSITIDVEGIPTLTISGVDTICIEDTWNITYGGDDLSNYNVAWSSDFGTISETTQDLALEFNAPGDYEVTMDAASDNCMSSPTTLAVVVLDSVRTPQATCEAFTDSIVFTWIVDPSECNRDEFILESSFAGFPLNTMTNSVTIPADPETEVELCITTMSDCACMVKTTCLSCTTLACPNYTIDISSDAADFCLDGVLNDVSLSALLDNNPLTTNINWAGDNIDNTGNISIDSDFTSGEHTYNLEYTEGTCMYNTDITLTFFEPIEVIYNTVQPGCIGDLFGEMTYLGALSDDAVYTVDGIEIDPTAIQSLDVGAHTIAVVVGGVCMTEETFDITSATNIEFEMNGVFGEVDFNEFFDYSIFSPTNDIADSIIWNTNDTIMMGTTVSLAITNATNLCATVYYNGQCEVEICEFLEIEPQKIFIPNVMSTIDGGNSEFTIFSNDVIEKVNYMKIYDRWGNLVFSGEDELPGDENLIWRGEHNGKKVPQGVYVYVIEVDIIGGSRPRIFTGDVTVIR